MEHSREESKKNEGQHRAQGEQPRQEAAAAKNSAYDSGKRARILQCLGNLNALHKVQGALLSQMEREIE